MTKKRLRTVQPAHKSDKVTVSQAKKAWLKVAQARSVEGSADQASAKPQTSRNSESHER
jgi:hypothetical protein